ncbi:hypothetical protein M427DRAFT_364764 [Gonapodya prolifera JEL478]|uniref:Uncharacterized protein n=1 Tax=Gonapodya prolifera (strain JEL478) TaxID=1344416 RepID=A0A139AB22_GONPJ|nr:hypothetical protein M427DRAFT_364764 [Gonapodya prolifera JEL478]|eukprot:KXS13593.1 hypothetical protein M427DRAFT_364764 [Gonapodya prolifera JEL478]
MSPSEAIRWEQSLLPPRSAKRLLRSLVAVEAATMLSLIGRGGHNPFGPAVFLAAIASLFFHPGRTVGSLIESIIFGLTGAVIGAIWTNFGSFLVAKQNENVNGDFLRAFTLLSVVLLLVVVMSILQARFPRLRLLSINSLIITILNLIQKVHYTTPTWTTPWWMVVAYCVGAACSLFSCLLVFPETASDDIRSALRDALTHISTAVHSHCDVFLWPLIIHDEKNSAGPDASTSIQVPGQEFETEPFSTQKSTSAQNSLRATLGKLSNALRESSYEFTVSWYSPKEVSQISQSLKELMRHCGGMYSGVLRREDLHKHFGMGGSDEALYEEVDSSDLNESDPRLAQTNKSTEGFMGSGILDEPNDTSSLPLVNRASTRKLSNKDRAVADHILQVYGELIAPSLHGLVLACGEELQRVQGRLTARDEAFWIVDHFRSTFYPQKLPPASAPPICSRLESAIREFDVRQGEAVQELKRRGYLAMLGPSSRLLVIYHFVFCMREFALELKDLGGKVDELWAKRVERSGLDVPMLRIWLPGTTLLRWMLGDPSRDETKPEEEDDNLNDGAKEPEEKNIGHLVSHAINGFVVRVLELFRHHDVVFGVKVALAVLIGSIWAFINPTSEFYVYVRGYWAVFTIVVCMTPTVGASVTIGLHRLMGTTIGAIWGGVTYVASSGSPYVIVAMQIPFAIGCLYLQLFSPYPVAGMISNITFLVVIFLPYTGSLSADISILEFTLMRAIAVVTGVGIAWIVGIFVAPRLARTCVRLELSRILYQLQIIYAKLISKLLDDTSKSESCGTRPRPPLEHQTIF